jgi:hypothetical protein
MIAGRRALPPPPALCPDSLRNSGGGATRGGETLALALAAPTATARDDAALEAPLALPSVSMMAGRSKPAAVGASATYVRASGEPGSELTEVRHESGTPVGLPPSKHGETARVDVAVERVYKTGAVALAKGAVAGKIDAAAVSIPEGSLEDEQRALRLEDRDVARTSLFIRTVQAYGDGSTTTTTERASVSGAADVSAVHPLSIAAADSDPGTKGHTAAPKRLRAPQAASEHTGPSAEAESPTTTQPPSAFDIVAQILKDVPGARERLEGVQRSADALGDVLENLEGGETLMERIKRLGPQKAAESVRAEAVSRMGATALDALLSVARESIVADAKVEEQLEESRRSVAEAAAAAKAQGRAERPPEGGDEEGERAGEGRGEGEGEGGDANARRWAAERRYLENVQRDDLVAAKRRRGGDDDDGSPSDLDLRVMAVVTSANEIARWATSATAGLSATARDEVFEDVTRRFALALREGAENGAGAGDGEGEGEGEGEGKERDDSGAMRRRLAHSMLAGLASAGVSADARAAGTYADTGDAVVQHIFNTYGVDVDKLGEEEVAAAMDAAEAAASRRLDPATGAGAGADADFDADSVRRNMRLRRRRAGVRAVAKFVHRLTMYGFDTACERMGHVEALYSALERQADALGVSLTTMIEQVVHRTLVPTSATGTCVPPGVCWLCWDDLQTCERQGCIGDRGSLVPRDQLISSLQCLVCALATRMFRASRAVNETVAASGGDTASVTSADIEAALTATDDVPEIFAIVARTLAEVVNGNLRVDGASGGGGGGSGDASRGRIVSAAEKLTRPVSTALYEVIANALTGIIDETPPTASSAGPSRDDL